MRGQRQSHECGESSMKEDRCRDRVQTSSYEGKKAGRDEDIFVLIDQDS